MPLPLDELVRQPELVNQRAQGLAWGDLLFEYELALDDMQAWLRGLSAEQIHFKPARQVYSIAEIVTHNTFCDEMLWSWIALLAQGHGAAIDPQTLVGGAGARNTAALLELEALNEACRTVARAAIDALPFAPDLAATAPHPHFGALNGKGWIYFMALHRGLHRYQCESVIDTPGFPRSASLQTQVREAYQPSERKTWLTPKAGTTTRGAARGKQKAGSQQSSTAAAGHKQRAAGKKTTTRSR
jgi:hypothetical protein